MEEAPYPEPPRHPNCRCEISPMTAIMAGTATENGREGADWTLMHQGELPDYYVTKAEAEAKGWSRRKWPCSFVPGKMITMGIYKNMNGHLPEKPGRLWFEADINYQTGKRNDERVLWSDDGLIFVTYDHYMTFYEIIPAERSH